MPVITKAEAMNCLKAMYCRKVSGDQNDVRAALVKLHARKTLQKREEAKDSVNLKHLLCDPEWLL